MTAIDRISCRLKAVFVWTTVEESLQHIAFEHRITQRVKLVKCINSGPSGINNFSNWHIINIVILPLINMFILTLISTLLKNLQDNPYTVMMNDITKTVETADNCGNWNFDTSVDIVKINNDCNKQDMEFIKSKLWLPCQPKKI